MTAHAVMTLAGRSAALAMYSLDLDSIEDGFSVAPESGSLTENAP